MTRKEAKDWIEQVVVDLDEGQGDDDFYTARADALLALIDREVAAVLKTERADAHWRSWDFGS